MNRRFPLAWPDGRPRTRSPGSALFRNPEAANGRVSQAVAEKRLTSQFNAMTKPGQPSRVVNLTLSMNVRYTIDGRVANSARALSPDDKGVAVYFDLDGRPHVLACDRWDTIADNIAAIAAHVEALRGQERWGVADLRQAFAGHAALPSPEQWWQVLGLTERATLADIDAAYRQLARAAHPDAGGSDAAMARLNTARDAGRKATS